MKRRPFLAGSGIAFAGALGGCLGSTSILGGSDEEAGLEFERWVPDPATFDREEYPSELRYLDLSALRDGASGIVAEYLDSYDLSRAAPSMSYAGLTFDDLTGFVVAELLFSIGRGAFDLEDLSESLESNDYARRADDELTIYEYEAEHASAAIGMREDIVVSAGGLKIDDEGDLIVAPRSNDPIGVIRAIFDASENEPRRYNATDSSFGALSEQLGAGNTGLVGRRRAYEETSIEDGHFAGQERWGVELNLRADETDFSEVFAFEEGVDPPADAVDDWLDTDNPHRWNHETATYDRSVTVDENVLKVTGTFETDDGTVFF